MRLILRLLGKLFIIAGALWGIGLCCIGAFFWLMESGNTNGDLDIEPGSVGRSIGYAALAIVPLAIGVIFLVLGKNRNQNHSRSRD